MGPLTHNCTFVPFSSYDWKSFSIDYACHGIHLPFNPAVYGIYAAFLAVTFWVALELLVQILGTFKRWDTMYFWSLTVTVLAIILRGIGLNVRVYSDFRNAVFHTAFTTFGWATMVTGSSLVLYSRLHLIHPNPTHLRSILLIIVGNSVFFQTPTIVVAFLSDNLRPARYLQLVQILSLFDIIFTLQEISLSSLYIYLFARFMRQGDARLSRDMRRMLHLLILIEVVLVAGHAVLNTLLYLRIYIARRMILGLIYAIKLRIEFVVLNSLMAFRLKRQTRLNRGSSAFDVV